MFKLTTKRQRAQQEAAGLLHDYLKIGDTAYTICTHVSRSGMLRYIRVLTADHYDISHLVAAATDSTLSKDPDKRGVKRGGCGMDMGFDVVYSMSRAMFPNGFICIGESENRSRSCPSNDHHNGDRDYSPHQHNSGGYAIRHKWL